MRVEDSWRVRGRPTHALSGAGLMALEYKQEWTPGTHSSAIVSSAMSHAILLLPQPGHGVRVKLGVALQQPRHLNLHPAPA